jgi:hypothetical protein
MHVQSQAEIGKRSERDYPENVIWQRGNVLFVTVNLPGSNNDLLPWYGTMTTRQRDEVAARTAADLSWLDRAFGEAQGAGAGAVVIGTQADMWDPAGAEVNGGDGLHGYDSVVTHLADLIGSYGKPVLLINGDSHVYELDHPMEASSPYYGFHPPVGDVTNFTRLTVQGSTNPMEWVEVTVDPSSSTPFTFVRHPVADTLP